MLLWHMPEMHADLQPLLLLVALCCRTCQLCGVWILHLMHQHPSVSKLISKGHGHLPKAPRVVMNPQLQAWMCRWLALMVTW